MFDGDIRSFECHVLDISADGAKLVTDIDAPIGVSFYLSAAPHALVRKPCEVIWRRGQQVGVKFTEENALTGESRFNRKRKEAQHGDSRGNQRK